VVASSSDEKKWETALTAAQSVLQAAASAPPAAPDYEAKAPIRQEQRRLKRAEVEALVADYRGGMSTYQVASKWQINRHTVVAILDRNGMKQRCHSVKLTEAELTEACALRRDGWSVNALARRYGISPGTMKKRLTSD
jgi:hypothetical protein